MFRRLQIIFGCGLPLFILEAAAHLFENLHVLVVLAQLVLRHHDAHHQLALSFGLRKAVDVVVDKFSKFRTI